MSNYKFCSRCGLWITFRRLPNGKTGCFSMNTAFFHRRTCKVRRAALAEAEQIRADYERAHDPNKKKILRLKKRRNSGGALA